jgi:hypothetical protein
VKVWLIGNSRLFVKTGMVTRSIPFSKSVRTPAACPSHGAALSPDRIAVQSLLHFLLRLSALCLHLRPHPLVRVLALFAEVSSHLGLLCSPPDEAALRFIEPEVAVSDIAISFLSLTASPLP